MITATVKTYNHNRGFGFAVPDGTSFSDRDHHHFVGVKELTKAGAVTRGPLKYATTFADQASIAGEQPKLPELLWRI